MNTRTMKTSVLIPGMALLLGASVAAFVPPEVSAGIPCCSITAVDRKTGIVTAKDTETGETFKIRLGDAAQIGNVKAGDQVSADFQTRKVTVHSFKPVEGILMRTPMPRPPIRRIPLPVLQDPSGAGNSLLHIAVCDGAGSANQEAR